MIQTATFSASDQNPGRTDHSLLLEVDLLADSQEEIKCRIILVGCC